MVPFLEKAEIIRQEQLTTDVYRLTAVAPTIARAVVPGQFIMVKVTDDLDPLLRRPFSVHRVLSGGRLQILFKVVGKGTGKLAASHHDQPLDMIGPLGRGFSFAGAEHICLIGGGMGIAPLFFLADCLRHRRRAGRKITVLLGAGTWAELAAVAGDLQEMDFAVHVATDDGSMGRQGLVTDLLAALDRQTGWTVYTCGPYPMLQAVALACGERGWRCQVSLETMMACGLAACLGCAVPKAAGPGYLHVCKDGPVFKAEEVIWR